MHPLLDSPFKGCYAEPFVYQDRKGEQQTLGVLWYYDAKTPEDVFEIAKKSGHEVIIYFDGEETVAEIYDDYRE